MNEYYDILQSFVTDIQKETIKAFAECDMNASKTAEHMYMCRNAVVYNLNEIKRKMGLDPRKFYDLIKLLEMVGDD